MNLMEALFKDVSTLFWLLDIEKCFDKTLRTFRSAIENLRLGSIKFFLNEDVLD